MTNLFATPANYDLPLSLGQDLVVDFQNTDGAGNLVDYPPDAMVTLLIDTSVETTANAAITGAHAVCFIPHANTDVIEPGILWRCVATIPGGAGTPPTVEVVAANGIVVRADGN